MYIKGVKPLKYIVKFTDTIANDRIEYLGAGTYTVARERYAVLVGNRPANAKRYSSRARAENAVKKLSENCENVAVMKYTIEEVEE